MKSSARPEAPGRQYAVIDNGTKIVDSTREVCGIGTKRRTLVPCGQDSGDEEQPDDRQASRMGAKRRTLVAGAREGREAKDDEAVACRGPSKVAARQNTFVAADEAGRWEHDMSDVYGRGVKRPRRADNGQSSEDGGDGRGLQKSAKSRQTVVIEDGESEEGDEAGGRGGVQQISSENLSKKFPQTRNVGRMDDDEEEDEEEKGRADQDGAFGKSHHRPVQHVGGGKHVDRRLQEERRGVKTGTFGRSVGILDADVGKSSTVEGNARDGRPSHDGTEWTVSQCSVDEVAEGVVLGTVSSFVPMRRKEGLGDQRPGRGPQQVDASVVLSLLRVFASNFA